MKSQNLDKRVTRAALVALIGIVIVVSVPGCKDSKDYREYYNRGIARLEEGKHDLAVSDFTKAIELDPQLAVAYGERAVIYFIKKEYDKVWENIKKQESLGLQADTGFLKVLREASGRKR
jgi:tetratricopeptide (TPR) repeat protein